MNTFTYEIMHRHTDDVLFAAELDAKHEGAASGFMCRLAVSAAVKAGANLWGAYLARADLRGADLRVADLGGAYLRGACLRGAYLASADLRGACLRGADLRGAYLASANLWGADLAGADLAGADLAGASLAGASLAGADFRGAKWRDGVTINRRPLFVDGLEWPVWILDDHMEIGCELHTFEDWAAFDDKRILGMAGKGALTFWRAHKDALLALAASDGRGETK